MDSVTTQTKDIPNFGYRDEDFIYQCASWDKHQKKQEHSKFDDLLLKRWESAMDQGVFKYKLKESELQYRVIPGTHKFVLSLLLKRATNRRMPEFIEDVNKPFDPNKFNFNKVKAQEVIMNLCPKTTDQHEQSELTIQNGYVNGSEENVDNSTMSESDVKNLVLLNISPFALGHVLMVPDVEKCINQKMTLQGMKLAIDMMLLSNHPGFRIAFNGLCALASVNHQHVHGWYMESHLWIETAPVKPVSGICYEVVDRMTRAFAFQLHGSTPDELARAVHKVTNYFQENDIAHNMFITRGQAFDDDAVTTTVRVILWPRKHFIGARSISDWESMELPLFYTAVAELGGHIPTYQPDRFDNITEEEIISIVQPNLLPDDEFDKLRDIVKSLMISLDKKSS